jgi:hypothetical protein
MDNEINFTPTANIWLDENDILHMELLPKAVLTLAAVQHNTEVVRRISNGKPRPVFIDIIEIGGITREARQYSAGEGVNEVLTALAILIGSPVTRTLGNIWFGINKPIFPARLFTSKDEALEWLRNFLP